MQDLLGALRERMHPQVRERNVRERHSRTYRCRCGNQVFFDNMFCLSCQVTLGFLPDISQLVALDPGPEPGTWRVEGQARLLKSCANRETAAACNWLMLAAHPEPHCLACRLNRTIPHLGDADNVVYWAKIEAAKRRLVSQLVATGLPVRSKVTEDPERGLMFDFLRLVPGGPPVMTGHANGLITINAEEADDPRREQIKEDLREPYRTLLGHFRHEVGHYYWDRLVWNSGWLEPFRALFGDERASYAEALKRNYEQGPPANWADAYISSYATMHPWEDWAETWAHFLHMIDSLGTAMGYGLEVEDLEGEFQFEPFPLDALYAPDDPNAETFLSLLNGWLAITMVLNELARSMGQRDLYPFVMSRPVVAKLQFVQMVVWEARTEPGL